MAKGNTRPKLHFGDSSEKSGFTSAGFTQINPTVVVRELIQNVLDAAEEAGNDVAKVRFEVDELPAKDVPGIESYKEAFEKAVEGQTELSGGKLPEAAQPVVDTIRETLARKTQPVLYVMDNGIGLDETRMGALLGDGLSQKGQGRAGSVGNGHLFIIPSSDLRYVFYGGVLKDNQRICAGHAVVASHEGPGGQLKAKDGYYVKSLTSKMQEEHEFADGANIPKCIQTKLDWVQERSESGSGAVVAILAYNAFREEEEESLWEIVSKVAACNFFVALHEKKLAVEVVDSDKRLKTLNHKNVQKVLERLQDMKQSPDGFIAGVKAHSAIEVLTQGERFKTEKFGITLAIQEKNCPTRIDLCRNGMWITNKNLPSLAMSKFSDKKSFHCLILLGAETAEIHSVVRASEGAQHNNLENKKRLKDEGKKILQDAMKDIYATIDKVVADEDSESFAVKGMFEFASADGAPGERSSRYRGPFEEIPPTASPRSQTRPPRPIRSHLADPSTRKNEKDRKHKRRQGARLSSKGLFRHTGKTSAQISLHPTESLEKGELQFILDQSLDSSCDEQKQHIVELVSAKVDGSKIPLNKLVQDEHKKSVAIPLVDKPAGQPIEIEISYKLPDGVKASKDAPDVVLAAQLLKATA